MHSGCIWKGGRSALQVALPLPFCTCPDQVPGLHQQPHVSLLEVLCAVSAQQPSGVAQHPQNTPMQQVVGHVCIHSSQRVIKEIEGFLLDRKNTADTMAQVLGSEALPDPNFKAIIHDR